MRVDPSLTILVDHQQVALEETVDLFLDLIAPLELLLHGLHLLLKMIELGHLGIGNLLIDLSLFFLLLDLGLAAASLC